MKIARNLGMLFLILSAPALAYLDPGPFTYFIHILLAGMVGLMFDIKSLFRKVVNLVAGKRAPAAAAPAETHSESEPGTP